MTVHPTAVVHPSAELGRDVEIGAFAYVGEDVRLGDGVVVLHHASVEGPAELGPGTRCFPFSAIGGPPQDLKYRGEPTRLVVGRDNVFREGVTVHRGTEAGGGVTVIGDGNLFMANSHVAHDCRVGSGCVFANSAAIAGHVQVGDGAVLGGMAGVHQFARVGRLAMVGAGAMVSQDVPPFTIAQGDRARLYGLNLVGLRRAGFDIEAVRALKRAYRLLFQRGAPLAEALAELRRELGQRPEVAELLDFVESSRRGICRSITEEGA